jgi:hypothetical protein
MNEMEWLACAHPERMLRSLPTKIDNRKALLFACACCRRVENLLRERESREALAALEQVADGAGHRGAGRTAAREAERALAALRPARDEALGAWQEASRHRETVWNSHWVGTPPPPWQLLRVAADACAAQAALTEVQAAEEAARAVAYTAEEQLDASAVATLTARARTLYREARAMRERASDWRAKAESESERVVSRSRAALRASQAVHWIERAEEAVDNKEPRLLRRWEREERLAQCAILRDLFGHLWHPVHLEPRWRRWHAGVIVQMARSIRDEGRFGDLPILADALEDAGCADAHVLHHCRAGGPHVRGCWLLDLLLGKS